ncbi:MAG: hypothetical protein KC503_36440, partial [Myxococcales bacterium]|nr:hypothetical protein [Myxococcales bacterium]
LRPGSPGVTSPGAGSSRFIARGAGSGSGANDPARWVSLLVYRVAAARADATRYAKVEQRISADAKLVFGYRNLGGAYRNLMILAVNAKGRVFWYYPAYRRGDTDPKSVAITAGTHQLGDEVQHDLSAGGALRLIAVFSRRPLQVSQVERAVGRALREAGSLEQLERLPLGAPGQTAQVTRLLRVTP